MAKIDWRRKFNLEKIQKLRATSPGTTEPGEEAQASLEPNTIGAGPLFVR
jgi:hypothetical protein